MHIDGIGVEGRKLVSFSWTSYLKDHRGNNRMGYRGLVHEQVGAHAIDGWSIRY